MAKQKPKKITPCHLLSFSSEPLSGSNIFLFSRSFGNFGPRMPLNPWQNQQKHPMSPAQLLLRTSPWVDFFCFLDVFATLAQKCPQTYGRKKQPMSLAQFFLRPFPWVDLFFRFFFFKPTMYVVRFFIFCFPVSWVPGGKLRPVKHPLVGTTLHNFNFSSFFYWRFNHQTKITQKINFITHLFRYSIGLMFYWYAEVCFPIFRGLVHVLQS